MLASTDDAEYRLVHGHEVGVQPEQRLECRVLELACGGGDCDRHAGDRRRVERARRSGEVSAWSVPRVSVVRGGVGGGAGPSGLRVAARARVGRDCDCDTVAVTVSRKNSLKIPLTDAASC